MSDLVKIARERIDGTLSSHWVGCERDHRECLIQRMADEIERLQADAARYRWLRDVDDDPYNLKSMWYAASPYDRTSGVGAAAVDAAIDAAMKGVSDAA